MRKERLAWEDIPAGIRALIDQAAGGTIVAATNQQGGFSPGTAARCTLADGRRVFVKATSPDQNPESPELHRREGRVAFALPPGLPVPALIGAVDDGRWVALVYEDVEGAPPAVPWQLEEVAATFSALDRLAETTTPCRIPGLRPVADLRLDGFRRLAGGDPSLADIDPWARRHLDLLAELEDGWEAAAAGESLLHADLRSDNLLLTTAGEIVIVDWAHACVGASWVDKVAMLPSIGLDGGPSPVEVEERLAPFAAVEPDALDCVIAAVAGFFIYGAAQPPPAGLPTLRAFQSAQAEVAKAWLAHRRRL